MRDRILGGTSCELGLPGLKGYAFSGKDLTRNEHEPGVWVED